MVKVIDNFRLQDAAGAVAELAAYDAEGPVAVFRQLRRNTVGGLPAAEGLTDVETQLVLRFAAAEIERLLRCQLRLIVLETGDVVVEAVPAERQIQVTARDETSKAQPAGIVPLIYEGVRIDGVFRLRRSIVQHGESKFVDRAQSDE